MASSVAYRRWEADGLLPADSVSFCSEKSPVLFFVQGMNSWPGMFLTQTSAFVPPLPVKTGIFSMQPVPD
ncbi:MAG TPA: hypothetical protein DCM58_00160 [Desulfovibrio sp.]|nr:hypothetical protein [Desulfovibrio sp.]